MNMKPEADPVAAVRVPQEPPALQTDVIWKLLNEADDHQMNWSTAAWRQWFVQIVDAVSGLENVYAREVEAAPLVAPAPTRTRIRELVFTHVAPGMREPLLDELDALWFPFPALTPAFHASAGSEMSPSVPNGGDSGTSASLVAPAGVPAYVKQEDMPQKPNDFPWPRETANDSERTKAATGRLPALDALLLKWRGQQKGWLLEQPNYSKAQVYSACADELESVLAGLRADPAQRQVLEEKDDQGSRVETGATLPSAGSIAKNLGKG